MKKADAGDVHPTDPEWQRQLLIGSLRQLALPAEEQMATLPAFVNPADEVADDFGNAFLLVGQLVKAGLVKETAISALERVHNLLNQAQGRGADSDFWTREGLTNDPLWESLRDAAREALTVLEV